MINRLIVLENQGGTNVVVVLLKYILQVGEVSDKEALIERIKSNVSEKARQEIMTVAQWLKEEGHKQGLAQGLEQGLEQGLAQGIHQGVQKAANALNLLNQGYDIRSVANRIGLKLEEVESLKKSLSH